MTPEEMLKTLLANGRPTMVKNAVSMADVLDAIGSMGYVIEEEE